MYRRVDSRRRGGGGGGGGREEGRERGRGLGRKWEAGQARSLPLRRLVTRSAGASQEAVRVARALQSNCESRDASFKSCLRADNAGTWWSHGELERRLLGDGQKNGLQTGRADGTVFPAGRPCRAAARSMGGWARARLTARRTGDIGPNFPLSDTSLAVAIR